MKPINQLRKFSPYQLKKINRAVEMSEDLVFNFFKLSTSQWLSSKYDIKTLEDLTNNEIVHGPFAQVIRYSGFKPGASLGSTFYDYYKICLQDHAIIQEIKNSSSLKLFPFSLYIISHELIHIVRFSKFLQNYEASETERMIEEQRVHNHTFEILKNVQVSGIREVFNYYGRWMELSFDS